MTQTNMTNDEFNARSIELAERTYRLKEKSGDFATSTILEQVGDELILVDQIDRFYRAQSFLEALTVWTDDVRSLAHEINELDKLVAATLNLSFEQCMNTLQELANKYSSSASDEVRAFGANLEGLLNNISTPTDETALGASLDSLLDAVEDLLINIHKSSKSESQSNVRLLRSIRDAILVKRQISVDKRKLEKLDDQDISQEMRVRASQEALEEVYEKLHIITPQAS